MKAIHIEEVRKLAHVVVPEPGTPGPGIALVRSHRMGICGTDYSCYLGKFPFFDYPRIPGHELGVEVLAVGEGVENVEVGDRCSVEPYMNCGNCYACRHGAPNCCQHLSVIGVMEDGGLCERFLVRADKLHPSKTLAYEQLALVETLAIGCHACDRGNPVESDNVLIIGAGPIGLAALEFVRLTGATATVMDMVDSRLQFCREHYGIENTILFRGDGSEIETAESLTDGDKFAVVIDATGHPGSMAGALNFLAPTGKLVFVGITTSEISFVHPTMHRPEATILASRNALPTDFTRIIQLIENRDIATDSWITHRTSFDNLVDAFEEFTRPESGVIKAVIEIA